MSIPPNTPNFDADNDRPSATQSDTVSSEHRKSCQAESDEAPLSQEPHQSTNGNFSEVDVSHRNHEIASTSPSSEDIAFRAATAQLKHAAQELLKGPAFIGREQTFLMVEAYMEKEGIEARYDGTLRVGNGPLNATTPEEFALLLKREDLNEVVICDSFMMEAAGRSIKVKRDEAKRAIRRFIRRARQERHSKVFLALTQPLSVEEHARADAAWMQLATIFEINPSLSVGVLKHHIWQVFQKAGRNPIIHHLMTVIYSAMQGSGKTTFASKFHGPLEELATGPVVLSEFLDIRNADIYRFPVALVDDVGQIHAKEVPILKSLITAQTPLRRRRMGTSDSLGVQQRTVLFGTSNTPIEELVPDASGHRRFATLPFANGNVLKGGDPDIWKTVDDTDYTLLWRSVDPLGPSPIMGVLPLLLEHQNATVPQDPLRLWLGALDMASTSVLNIKTKYGIRASDLFDLFVREAGSEMTSTRFGKEIQWHFRHPDVPFHRRIEHSTGRYYTIKPNFARQPPAALSDA